MEPNETISSGLLELYVLGMATEQEAAQVEAMARQYPEIAAELGAIEESLEAYAHAEAVQPASSVKARILNSISGAVGGNVESGVIDQQAPVIAMNQSRWKYAAAASIILLLGSILFAVSYYKKYNDTRDELLASKDRNAELSGALAQQEAEAGELNNKWRLFQSKNSEAATLKGLPPAPGANAKIIWMKDNGEVYIDASNLPDAPAGMQYQFWGIVDGKPVDGGMIITNSKDDKFRIHKMKSFGRAEAFAVTLETAGGNPQPKGQMYVMGKM